MEFFEWWEAIGGRVSVWYYVSIMSICNTCVLLFVSFLLCACVCACVHVCVCVCVCVRASLPFYEFRVLNAVYAHFYSGVIIVVPER